MIESHNLAKRLLPELTAEFAKTRAVLANLPDGQLEFKAHEKSMPLTRLAGHTAELAGFAALILTLPSIDAGTPSDPRKILRMQTVATLLAEFDALADSAITALKTTTDEVFDQTFTLSVKGDPRFSGSRYDAYRNIALNHMIHHRAQLGVYLRLLERPVPPTFGPTADQK